jgi:adenine-specific DNA-methyltransferase
MLSKYSIDDKVIKKEILYREYKNIKSSKKGDKLFELLLYIKKPVGFMKSPLNYSGSKDKIMPQIYKFFPPKISTFIDVMGGAFNVGINVVADEVIYNEYNPFVFELIKTIIEMDSNDIISYVEKQINKYGLTNGASEAYKKFRDMYNYSQTKKPLDLFILTMYCFQNQIRFNGNLEFNTPVGNCAYNQTIKSRLFKFKPRTNKVIFTNLDFTNIKFENYDKDALFYFDPPYFITNATYNDGKRGFKGWDAIRNKVVRYITDLHSKGYRFLYQMY